MSHAGRRVVLYGFWVLALVWFGLASHSTDLGMTSNPRPIIEIYLRDAAAQGIPVERESSSLQNTAGSDFAHSSMRSKENNYVFYFQPNSGLPNGHYKLTAFFLKNGVLDNDPEVILFQVDVESLCGNTACDPGEDSQSCPNDCPSEATCSDQTKNGDESDIDCGGSCPKCGIGKQCDSSEDCESNNCVNGTCQSLCGNGVCDSGETAQSCPVDCQTSSTCAGLGGMICSDSEACPGNKLNALDSERCCSKSCTEPAGSACEECGTGLFNVCDQQECYSILETCLFASSIPSDCVPCSEFSDCSAYEDEAGCVDNHCNFSPCEWTGVSCVAAASCSDEIKNSQESDVDCGGSCPKCDKNEHCNTASDCLSGLCVNSTCKNPTCGANDGCVVNCLPRDADCPPAPSCSEDGNCVEACPVKDPDCTADSCLNRVKDGQESDVDCGGDCPKCKDGDDCVSSGDCISNECLNSVCVTNTDPSCEDGVKNGDETDVDCGGMSCPKCAPPKKCEEDSDCMSNLCSNGQCLPPPTCLGGDACKVNCLPPDSDCPPKPSCLMDEMCVMDCQPIDQDCPTSTCTNSMRDGDEVGVDCGGSCPACPVSELTVKIVSVQHDFSQTARLKAGFLPVFVQAETNRVAYCSLTENVPASVDESKLFTGESSKLLRTFHEGKIELTNGGLISLSVETANGSKGYRKTLYVRCKDDLGNEEQVSEEAWIPAVEAYLRVPSLGVAGSVPFKVVVETLWPTFCTYAQIPLSGVSSGALFDDNPVNSLKYNHTLNSRSVTGDLNIACKASDASEGELFKTFNVKVDTTPPVLDVSFDPANVSDRASKFSDLTIHTDDETLCTVDNGTVTKVDPYDEQDLSTYLTDRSVTYDFRAIYDSNPHTFSVNTTCKNRAGLRTSKVVTVTVQLDDTLDIIPKSPPAYTSDEVVDLRVETTKKAVCTYEGAARSGSMTTSDQEEHSVSLSGLSEGAYTFKVTCMATASPDRTVDISTRIDRTAPTVDSVEAVTPQCSLALISAEIKTEDPDASSFQITLLDGAKQVLSETRTDKSLALKASLEASKQYTLTVIPVDKAGNEGTESTAYVDALDPTDQTCDKIKPKGSLEVDSLEGRAAKKAIVKCDDGESGCTPDFLRGEVEPDGNCVPNEIEFYGSDVEVSDTVKFCYTIFDNNNNSYTEARVIDVPIPESCLNGMQDLNELGVDCGLGCPQGCPDDTPCTLHRDCLSDYCGDGVCKQPSCIDEVKNGNEVGVDCGGDCPRCKDGEKCVEGGDCASGYCSPDRFCRTPSCNDGFRNGLETDKDCGGNCPPCNNGKTCANNDDCESKFCGGGTCVADKSKDSDRDGMPDWWEIKYTFSTKDASDANQDADGDGFTNAEEYQAGTDPRDPKSRPESRVPPGPFTVLMLGVLLILGGVGYLLYKRNQPKAPPPPPAKSAPPKPPVAPRPSLKAVVLKRGLARKMERERVFSLFGSRPTPAPSPKPVSKPSQPPVKAPTTPPPPPSQPVKSPPKPVQKVSAKPKKKPSIDKDMEQLEKLAKF